MVMRKPLNRLPTEEFLTKKLNWWWRPIKSRQDCSKLKWTGIESIDYHSFLYHFERAAWMYELGKRLTGKYEFDSSFIELSRENQVILSKRWPQPENFQRAFGVMDQFEDTINRPGWIDFGPVRLNLNRNDKDLTGAFQDQIKAQRITYGIPNPHQGKGKHLRSLSWKSIELLDISQKYGGLTLSQRALVNKAKRRHTEWLKKF